MQRFAATISCAGRAVTPRPPAPGPSPVMKSGAVVATGHGQGPQTHLTVDTHLRCGRISSPASHIQPLEETQMN